MQYKYGKLRNKKVIFKAFLIKSICRCVSMSSLLPFSIFKNICSAENDLRGKNFHLCGYTFKMCDCRVEA